MMILLTSIPLVVLAMYFTFAMREFQKDKEAYVYDSSVAVAKSLAMQIRVEVESYLSSVKPIIEAYDANTGSMSDQGRALFAQFSRQAALLIFRGDAAGNYIKLTELTSPGTSENKFLANIKGIEDYRARAAQKGLVVSSDPNTESSLVIASRLGKVSDPSHLVIIGLYRAETLLGAFARAQIYRSLLLDENGQIALGPKNLKGTPLDGENLAQFFEPVMKGQLPESSFGLTNSRGQKTLVSYAVVGIGDLKVASVVDRKEALKAVDVLIFKSVLIYIALVLLTVLVSAFASMQLTSKLRELYEATRKIASGKFDVRVRSTSTDEIGGLADGFNVMAAEVSRLMSETAEKARMENELATVRTVQETLFPPSEGQFDRLHIVGHFEPASECGGDWWNYSKVGDKIFLWIGDATGHGAPAALITSAARSAAAIIEGIPDMTPSRGLEIMNRAIHETSKGKINMTFFLAMVDTTSGILTYANASHDPPYLIRKADGRALSKRDLEPLMDVNGLRLGEKIGSKYDEVQVQLNSGDAIVFYTDGVLDLQDSAGKKWGERTFLKMILDANSASYGLSDKMAFVRRNIAQFRGDAQLLDDITLFMVEYKEAA
ncbi:MAG: SpoIIE family protein phosphatase [Bdellovibrionales bacterium]